ncbi:DUF2207 domain-containing protein [Sporosarcina sp. BI001-red]|uniref:DUF2207 domain-containing protein n=1 Tax=Sporosarcina sp. BI001-red TaxID=2282866 RepID=UPI001314DE2B|nr:DUF2207 domain-containing protein [Sporosarcina sp. BI001-red]
MKKILLSVVMLVLLIVFPIPAFADDFTINDFKIDAHLETDGNVQVKELLTYEFDGDFNGITRDLYPKKGSEISDLHAEENGKPLKIEGKNGNYKIHRKAKDETVAIELTYTIVGGVEKYADMAQFYWPFFDDRNETDFENVVITVRPPKATEDVIAMGYNAARGSEVTDEEGTVVFNLGEVSAGTNADVRVGVDEALFPGAVRTSDKQVRPELEKEQASLIAAQARFDKMHKLSGKVAPFIFGGAVLLLLLIGVYVKQLKNKRRAIAMMDYPEAYFVPEAIMSLPSTLRYTVPHVKSTQVQTTALLELLRKGYIEREGEDAFRVINRDTEYEHERLLIEWLFDGFGSGDTFSYSDLEVLEGDKLSVQQEVTKYNKLQIAWEKSIYKEIDENQLKGGGKGVRVLSAIAGFLLIAPMIAFGIYNQPMWLLFLIFPSIILVLFGFLYGPKTVKGHGLQYQWEDFQKRLPEVTESDLNEQLDDDQKRAVIFGIGTKTIDEKKLFSTDSTYERGGVLPIMYYFPIGTLAYTQLNRAGSAVAASTTSSSSGGGGGGVGGGGGGAGAF